jgi:hypothetical protein
MLPLASRVKVIFVVYTVTKYILYISNRMVLQTGGGRHQEKEFRGHQGT